MEKNDVRICPCGNPYMVEKGCDHEGEPYTLRIRTPHGDGVESGVIGPAGNQIPLTRIVFEETQKQEYWFDAAGFAYPYRPEPYPPLETYEED